MLDRLMDWLAARLAPHVARRLAASFVPELHRHLQEIVLPQARQQAEADAVALQAQLRAELRGELQADIAMQIGAAVAAQVQAELAHRPLTALELWEPGAVMAGADAGEYMRASVPLTRDFMHVKFIEFARAWGFPPRLHRKFWEWAFIHEHFERAGMLQPGKRGVGFGVGQERLPALFARAGVNVMATDDPSDDEHWRSTGQHAARRDDLFDLHILDRAMFDERVGFEPCDMKHIPPHLTDFDFCWSSCCFEHLGNLDLGIEFVINSVERVLKPGGIACHTTELNLTSDEETFETGRDVVYRKSDLLRLSRILEERGHSVEPLRLEPGDLPPDYLVDLPPFHAGPHLKLMLGPYVCTSVGLVIRRGR